jgi:MFS family permease
MSTTAIQDRFAGLRLGPPATLWLVYALFFVAGVAQAAVVPLLPRLSARYGLSGAETALLLALPGLATLAVSVPSGLAADRFGARRVTLGAGVLLCLSCLAQAAPSLPALLLGRVAFGVAFGVVWTTGMAWLADFDGGGGSRLGPSVTCSSVGIMLGPAVGGILAQSAGLAAPFMAIAAAAAVVIVPLGLACDPGQRDRSTVSGEPEPAVSPRVLRSLVRRPRVRAAAGALVVSGAVSSASQLLISGGLHRLNMSTGQIGLMFSAAAVCYIVVSAAIVRLGDRARTLRFNAAATAVLALSLAPALSGGGPVVLAAALLLSAAPRAAISTIAYSLAAGGSSQRTGGDGFVFGMLNGAWAAATVLMPLLAGALEQGSGARAAYLAVIVPSCAVALWLLAGSRPRRTTVATVAPAGATAAPPVGATTAAPAGASGRSRRRFSRIPSRRRRPAAGAARPAGYGSECRGRPPLRAAPARWFRRSRRACAGSGSETGTR